MAEYIDIDTPLVLPVNGGAKTIERTIRDILDVNHIEYNTADVAEVRHGKWEDDGIDGIGVFGIEYRWQKCSECGYTFTKIPSQPLQKFCHNCGARMDGES